MIPRLLTSLAVALASLLSGCATWYDARFVPAPLEVKLEDSATPDLSGRALISVTGLRRADRHAGTPVQFELAMRLENLGSVPFTVDPSSFQLVTADLATLESATLSPSPPPTVEPGKTAQLSVVFPLPAGQRVSDYDLSGLNLRWALSFAGRRMVMGANFERQLPPRYYYGYHDSFYDSPGWYWHSHVHVGRFCAY